MTRREPFAFIDFHSNDEPRKAFCRICEETTGRSNRLVPRYVIIYVMMRLKSVLIVESSMQLMM